MNIEIKAELQSRIVKHQKRYSEICSEVTTRTFHIIKNAESLESMIRAEEKDKEEMIKLVEDIIWSAAFLKEFVS